MHYRDAYDRIRQTLSNSAARSSFEERRDNADLIMIKMMQIFLGAGNFMSFLDVYRSHFQCFQQKFSALKREVWFEEYKWRANWQRIVGDMLHGLGNHLRTNYTHGN